MKGYRPRYFDKVDTSQTDLLQEDRARRIPRYARRVAQGEPLFEESKSVAITQEVRYARIDGRARPTPHTRRDAAAVRSWIPPGARSTT
jgi:hypothetical protein